MSLGFSEIRRADSDGASEANDLGSIPGGLATGAILRERREAMGVTLEEAEASIRIRQKYLAAMESDEWHLLPGEIVGRGFLRNYAAYLDLEPTEMLERRRSVVEPRVAAALRGTSAGSALPPTREVNYSPKELDLKDEPEGIEGATFNFRGLLPILALALLAFLIWQSFDLIQSAAGAVSGGIQERLAAFQESATQPRTNDGISAENGGNDTLSDDASSGTASSTTASVGQQDGTSGSSGGNDTGENGNGTNNNQNPQAASAPTESATNTVEPPTPTPEPPTPTSEPPTPTPEPPTPAPLPPTPVPVAPTPEPPTPAPAVPEVAAPACPDGRSIITSPGQGQIVTGAVEVIGSATHEAFQFYKLEYAPGDGSGGGWAYFDGGQSAIAQGRLGTLDTRSLANGTYTVRLVVVDLTANFPPPCQATISIQN